MTTTTLNTQRDLAMIFIDALTEVSPKHDVDEVDLLDTLACNNWIFREDYEQPAAERKLFAGDLSNELRSFGHVYVSKAAIERGLKCSGLGLTQGGLTNEASAAYFEELAEMTARRFDSDLSYLVHRELIAVALSPEGFKMATTLLWKIAGESPSEFADEDVSEQLLYLISKFDKPTVDDFMIFVAEEIDSRIEILPRSMSPASARILIGLAVTSFVAAVEEEIDEDNYRGDE